MRGAPPSRGNCPKCGHQGYVDLESLGHEYAGPVRYYCSVEGCDSEWDDTGGVQPGRAYPYRGRLANRPKHRSTALAFPMSYPALAEILSRTSSAFQVMGGNGDSPANAVDRLLRWDVLLSLLYHADYDLDEILDWQKYLVRALVEKWEAS